MPIDYENMSASKAVKKFVKNPQSRIIQITMSKKNWDYLDANARILAKRHKEEFTDEIESLISIFVHVGMITHALPESIKRKLEESADAISKAFSEEDNT